MNLEQCCQVSLFPDRSILHSKSHTYFSRVCPLLVTLFICPLFGNGGATCKPVGSSSSLTIYFHTLEGNFRRAAHGQKVHWMCACVCVFGAVKMLPVSISHFVCSCSFNGFIFPAKLEKFLVFSLPLRVGHLTRCHPFHLQHKRLCATSAASWLLLIMCPTHTHTHKETLSAALRTVHTPLNCNFWQHFGLHKSWGTAVATCTVPGTCSQYLLLFLAPAWQSQVPHARANKTFAHVSSLLKSTQHIMVT